MRYCLIALCLFVSACVSTGPENALTARSNATPSSPCERQSASRCLFVNAPVSLLPKVVRLKDRPLPFFRTDKAIEFVDARPAKWIAPRNTLTDGASIPTVFLSAVGNPRSKEFLNAATMHDAYCGIGNQNLPQYHSDRWRNVHRMFYDALRVDGTPPKKAKIMYAAVYLGGPRWAMPGESPKVKMPIPGLLIITAPVVQGPSNTPLPKVVPKPVLEKEMDAAIAFINNTNPSIARLDAYLMKREREILSELNQGNDRNKNQVINDNDTGGGFGLPSQ